MRTIILEGPPGGGKFALAARLELLGYAIRRVEPAPRKNRTEETVLNYYVEHARTALARPTVLINFSLAGRIYDDALGARSYVTARVEDLVVRLLEARDVATIVALPPWRVVANSWVGGGRKGSIRTIEQLRAVYRGFARRVFNQNSRFVLYDETRHRLAHFADCLTSSEGYPLPDGVVGAQRPRFLFVGERSEDPRDLPFLSARASAGWLYDVIKDAGFREREIAFVNALRHDRSEANLTELISRFSAKPTLVALGEVARRAALKTGRAFYPFEHPQYVKRFKNEERAKYVAALAHVRRSAP